MAVRRAAGQWQAVVSYWMARETGVTTDALKDADVGALGNGQMGNGQMDRWTDGQMVR